MSLSRKKKSWYWSRVGIVSGRLAELGRSRRVGVGPPLGAGKVWVSSCRASLFGQGLAGAAGVSFRGRGEWLRFRAACDWELGRLWIGEACNPHGAGGEERLGGLGVSQSWGRCGVALWLASWGSSRFCLLVAPYVEVAAVGTFSRVAVCTSRSRLLASMCRTLPTASAMAPLFHTLGTSSPSSGLREVGSARGGRRPLPSSHLLGVGRAERCRAFLPLATCACLRWGRRGVMTELGRSRRWLSHSSREAGGQWRRPCAEGALAGPGIWLRVQGCTKRSKRLWRITCMRVVRLGYFGTTVPPFRTRG